MARRNRLLNNKLKMTLLWVVIALLCVGMIFAFVKMDRNETTKTIGTSSLTYAIGIIDAEGEYEQGTSSIYMKKLHSVDGLTCELDEDATITYKIVFYDEDEKFVDSTGDLSLNYDGTAIPTTAKYFRIEITPTNDAEVSFMEIGTYASQLTVKVNK